LFKTKINIGITINPENDIALVRDITSCKIIVLLGNNIWKKTRKNNEVRIAKVMFAIKSAKELFKNLKELKNSIGRNSRNKATKKINKLQNRLWPDQVVIDRSEKLVDSKNKYTDKPSKQVPKVKKYKLKVVLSWLKFKLKKDWFIIQR